ncbi:MAG: EAL domain-containing protein [Thiobacillaceae bacterium]|jgi:diguanylate cyclase (GGDEF)-like protein/PAS domain S-box-containing protein|nr:EAL domain-containing protein [Thiobacillaceae bacterium]
MRPNGLATPLSTLHLVMLVGMAGLLAGLVGIHVAQDIHWIRLFDNLHWTAGTSMAAAFAWLGVRAARSESVAGLGWIAIGLTVYAAGQIVWNIQTVVGYAGSPSPSDLLYLWLGPCVAIGLLVESFRMADRIQRKTLLLDAAILAIAALMLVLLLYLPQQGDMPLLSMAVLVAYPVSLFTAASIGLIAAPTLRLKFSWSYWLFLVLLVVTGICWMAWNLMLMDGADVDGTWFNSLFSVSITGLGLTTLYWKIEPSRNALWERLSEGFLRLLPLLAVVVAGFAVILADPHDGVPRSVSFAVDIAALVVIVLAMFKQSMLLREHELLKVVTRNLEESEQQKNLILRTMPDLVWLKDADGIYRMCNPAFERFYDLPESDIVGKSDFDHSDPEMAEYFRQKDLEVMLAGHPVRMVESVTFADDGHPALLETLKTPLRDASGKVCGVLGIARDVTERESVSRELALVSFALNHVGEAAYLADEAGYFQYVNDEACLALGHPRDVLLGLRVIDVDCDCTGHEQWKATWEKLKEVKAMTFESTHKTRDGSVFPVEISANYFEFSGQAYVLGLVRDITERKQVEEQIRSLAYFDALTKLPNRRLLMDRLGHALVSSQRSRQYGALLILDLDHFKTLNDTQGHDVGDRLLVETARRLSASVREEDTVCRLGGDEFVVMLEGLGDDEQYAASQAETIAEKVRFALNQPYSLNFNEAKFHGTTSIGLTLFRGQDASLEVLLKQADVALYQAKDAGRNLVRFFNPAMQAAIDSRTVLEASLRRALEHGEFRLFYQPQVDHEGALIGAEALLRWQPPGQEMIYPDAFIALAEDTGLILAIGQWVLGTACAQLKTWESDPRTRSLQVSVNVSARQFHQHDFVETVQRSLDASGIDPARLKLELTESVVLDNVDMVVSRMQQLIALGVSFCLDDFGTGYSSLSYLKRLPLDQVKIDQSFVRDVTEDQNDAAIVRAIMAMSRSLGLKVIAEGVETQAQRDFLLQNECRAYQGFLFCGPVPIEEWERLLK